MKNTMNHSHKLDLAAWSRKEYFEFYRRSDELFHGIFMRPETKS